MLSCVKSLCVWPCQKAVCVCVAMTNGCVCLCVCAENGKEAFAGLSPVQCVLVPPKDVCVRASGSISMIRAVAAKHVVRKGSMQATCRGGLKS